MPVCPLSSDVKVTSVYNDWKLKEFYEFINMGKYLEKIRK
jgi:hypothetical protein